MRVYFSFEAVFFFRYIVHRVVRKSVDSRCLTTERPCQMTFSNTMYKFCCQIQEKVCMIMHTVAYVLLSAKP